MCMLAPSKAIQAPQHQRLSGKALLEQRSAWVQSLLPAFGTAPQSTNTTFLCTLAIQRTALVVEIHDLAQFRGFRLWRGHFSCTPVYPPHGSSNVSGGQHTQKRPTAALSGWVSTSWPQEFRGFTLILPQL